MSGERALTLPSSIVMVATPPSHSYVSRAIGVRNYWGCEGTGDFGGVAGVLRRVRAGGFGDLVPGRCVSVRGRWWARALAVHARRYAARRWSAAGRLPA